ncbi:MAG: lipid-A-disaccharide synthase [Cyanobacteria bacterium QS_8_64_29]|nr:MAG: lipid-A-disaccharide synthase [Cyanobacteria bacterium QS_8_64_29]
MSVPPADILILSNGPGEIATWVRPVMECLRQRLGDRARLSLVLAPCRNATGTEAQMARQLLPLDRVQGPQHFWPFLLWGRTAEGWDWRDRGVVLFLGGDQFFPLPIGKRLGYPTVVYGEWETRWLRWHDRFGVPRPEVAARAPRHHRAKIAVVGDLMADVSAGAGPPAPPSQPLVGLLPGSKPAKLAQGLPLMLASAEAIQAQCPQARFALPVAPTLDPAALARFGDPARNPLVSRVGGTSATLERAGDELILTTARGTTVALWTHFPAHPQLAHCTFCLTTVGANTAELGALGVPAIVLLPTQQLDAMRAWDGVPGLLANLPGVGAPLAKLINAWVLRQKRAFAWPNIWTGETVMPELVGQLTPERVAALALAWLQQSEELAQRRQRLQQACGQPGAAERLADLAIAAIAR